MHNDASASERPVRPGRLRPTPLSLNPNPSSWLDKRPKRKPRWAQSLGEIGQNVDQAWRQATDVRGLIERHPWLALGAAAAVGFAGARILRAGLSPAPVRPT